MSTPQQKAARRRRSLPGFPKDFVFQDYDVLREYFSGDAIQCLRCGRMFRSIGIHLKTIHNITPDEYREMYGIPWTYGLTCAETKEIKAEISKAAGTGGHRPIEDVRAMARAAHKCSRAIPPARMDLLLRTLAKANEANAVAAAMKPKVVKPPKPQRVGKPSPAPRGSPEFREKMRRRPQCTMPVIAGWWTGKKQSDEHVLNRTGHRRKKG